MRNLESTSWATRQAVREMARNNVREERGRVEKRNAAFWGENTRPIHVSPGVPSPLVPDCISLEGRQRIREMAREMKENGILDWRPYDTVPSGTPFETYIPTVMAGVVLETISADPSDDTTACTLPDIRYLWDTGAHYTMITKDMLPNSFVEHIEPGSRPTAVQLGIDVQFSNCTGRFETVCVVCPYDTFSNFFSGLILGKRAMPDFMDYQVVSRKLLQAKGVDLRDDELGEIRLLGRVVDGEYQSLS